MTTVTLRQHQAFSGFLNDIKDGKVRAAVIARIHRPALGNPGDHASVGDSVHELRIHLGAGWRVYYGKVGEQVILLLGGGNKHGQQADIDIAKRRFDEYRRKPGLHQRSGS